MIEGSDGVASDQIDRLNALLAGRGSGTAGPPCFWSYARGDNQRIGGKLDRVTADLQNFYKFETGQDLPVFKDVNSIGWGQQWQERIPQGIQNVMFMIPAITPNFLTSQACRDEILQFHALCRQRGVQDLILPIVFSGRHLLKVDSEDEVAQIVARAQYVSFDDVWFTDPASEKWQSSIHAMIQNLIAADERAVDQLAAAVEREARDPAIRGESRENGATTPASDAIKVSGAQGPSEQLESTEGVEDADDRQISELLVDLEDEVDAVGRAMNKSIDKLRSLASSIQSWNPLLVSAKSPREINNVLFRMSVDLSGPANRFLDVADAAYSNALSADADIRRLGQIAGSMADQSFSTAFRSTLRQIEPGAIDAMVTEIDSFLPQIQDAQKLSSILRKSLGPVNDGGRKFRDVAMFMRRWAAIGRG